MVMDQILAVASSLQDRSVLLILSTGKTVALSQRDFAARYTL